VLKTKKPSRSGQFFIARSLALTCPAVPRSELCSTTGVVKFIRKFLLWGIQKWG